MTTFRPCIGCTARKDCAIKKGVAAALRGQPVTSAKIKCALPFTEHFPPGTRVKVMVWDHRDWRPPDEGPPAKMASATVVGPSTKKAGRLLTHLDEPVFIAEENSIEFRAAWPKDVEKLDEPRREWCEKCKRAYVNEQCSCNEHVDDARAW